MLLPHAVWLSSYALLWALETERLPMDDARAIRTLTPAALCRLVADIAHPARMQPTSSRTWLPARWAAAPERR
jgi:hypothetical protein